MPYFSYSAKNQLNEVIKGKVEAANISDAASLLNERGVLIISLKPLSGNTFSSFFKLFFGIKHDDIVTFTQQLSTMITAGLPLSKAIGILVSQARPGFSELVATILQDIEGGKTFSEALSKHSKYFSRLYIQLVKAGEVGGVLDQVLSRLAINMEKAKEFRAKTKGALIYPVIVVVVMAAVGFVMMAFVLPKLTAMFSDFGTTLPLPTVILIGISNFFAKFWYAILAVGAISYVAFRKWSHTEFGQHWLDGMVLKIPIIGVLVQKMVITEFVRTLSLLLGAGVTLLQALEIVTEGVDNVIFRDAFKEAQKGVEKGDLLSEIIAGNTVFPPLLSQMISVGEETGKLDEVLEKLSHFYESETEHAVKNLTTALEPLIMIVLAIGVGGMVVAVIMPIYSLTSSF